MPSTAIFSMIGLGPKINADSKNPRATAKCRARDIVTTETDPAVILDQIKDQMIVFVDKAVLFRVPNPTGDEPSILRKLYLTNVDPDFWSPNQVVAQCEWGIIDAAPGGRGESKKPSDKPKDEELGGEYSFDTQGGTKHITQSVFTRDRRISGGGAFSGTDFKQAIGVDKDGVKGCDIYAGDFKWSVKVDNVPVTADYIAYLRSVTGKINDHDFYGRKAEELLFLGAQGSYTAGKGGSVTYSFHEKENKTDVLVDPFTTFTEVNGHDHVWCNYKKGESVRVADGKTITVQVPDCWYVEQVYEWGDFDKMFDYPPSVPEP